MGALVGGLITGLCISYVGGYLGSGLEPLGALVLLMVCPDGPTRGHLLPPAGPEGVTWRPSLQRLRVCSDANPWSAIFGLAVRSAGVVLYVVTIRSAPTTTTRSARSPPT